MEPLGRPPGEGMGDDAARELEPLAQPDPYQQALLLMAALEIARTSWEIKADFRKDGNDKTVFKLVIRTTRARGSEPLHERRTRMLCQGLINLPRYSAVIWVSHAVDPESGEVLIDEFVVPTQWRTMDGNLLVPDPQGSATYYSVVLTPSGCRCDCPYALNAPTDPEITPWGPQPSGSTAPCPHSEVARFIQQHALCARPRA